MAVLNCKECGNQVSTKAKRCPKCGAKAPEEPPPLIQSILSLVLVGSIVVFVIHGCINTPNPTPTEQAEQDAEYAVERAAHTCSNSIKEILNDPDSAKFDYDNISTITKTKGNSTIWNIKIPVRTKNPFNATISALFQCEVKKIGDDEPETLSINRIE